ncbi:MAG: flagellar FliL protein [Pseudohongiellaceae bacterium]|jgi:flagellar FliL protein
MADNTQEKELDLDAEQAAADADSKAKSKKKLLIAIGVAVALAAAAGGYFFLMGEEDSEEVAAEEVEVPIQEAFYLKLEPVFIINLPDKGKQRFLQTSVTVMSRSNESILMIQRHMPVIRHHLTNVLSAQTISSVQSPGGIESARIQALGLVNRLLVDDYGAQAIEQVLFTSFVMQ